MRCRPLVNYKTINSCHKDNQLPCRERPASIYRTFQEILNPCLDNHESILNLLQKYWENFPSPDFPFVPWCSKGCRNDFLMSSLVPIAPLLSGTAIIHSGSVAFAVKLQLMVL